MNHTFNNLICIIIIIFSANVNSLEYFVLPKLCKSQECFKLGNSVFESLDKSFSPCDDFYNFACNGWITKTNKPAHSLVWNKWHNVEINLLKRVQLILKNGKYNTGYFDKVRQFYKTCVNRDVMENIYLQELKLIISRIAPLPIHAQTWNENGYNWLIHLAEITKLVQTYPIFKILVGVDVLQTDNLTLYITKGDTVLPLQVLSDPRTYSKELQTYKRWIFQSFKHIYKQNLVPDANKQVLEIIEFEIKLARIMQNIGKLNRKETTLNKIVQNKESFYNAYQLLYRNTSIALNKENKVVMENDAYTRQVLRLVQKSGVRVVANYLGWYLIKELSRDATPYLRNLNFLINKSVFGVTSDVDVKDGCTQFVMENLGFSLTKIYSDIYVDKGAVQEVENMIVNVKSAFLSSLKSNQWLNYGTRELVVKKVENLRYFVGYPDWASNHTALEKYFGNLRLSDNHLLNILQIKQFNFGKNVEMLTKDEKIGWWLKPFEINAGYSILLNAMVIPIGMLDKPFFDIERPMSFNYGSLGYIIGHELSHSLDNKGRRANENGQIRTWWWDSDVNLYENRIDCFKNQYESFGVDSYATISENIADNVGLNISWAAFKKLENNTHRSVIPKLEVYNDEQLFFISFAQTSCEIPSNNPLLSVPAYADDQIRILTATSNNLGFLNAFHCKVSDKNAKQCTLW